MRKRKILIVDDERDFVKTMAFQLEFKGYEVATAYTAEDALDKAKDKPELILLDLIMPKMDGYEICAKLRGDPKTKNIPIIMLTCKEEVLDKIKGLKIGADDYITKTMETEELFARIEAILRRRDFFVFAERETAALLIELREIIDKKSIDTLFQPIVTLPKRKTVGFEIFTRGPRQSILENPKNLFYVAYKCDMLFELEMIVCQQALSKLSNRYPDALLFFNANPAMIHAENFHKILDLYDKPERIVLEITERMQIPDFKIFAERLAAYKKMGFKISLDDIGSGYASLEAIVELKPDIAKIDKCLIEDIAFNKTKRYLVETIYSMCKRSSISVVAEGIEKEEQLVVLNQIGVEYGQGYLLGFPEQA